MQTTDSQFDEQAVADVRRINWSLRASFPKELDDDVNLFVLNQSLLDGTDLLGPTDRNFILPWDKYDYVNYDDRVISMEYTSEEKDPYSATEAIADIVLNNYDELFSPGSNSPLSSYILPRRPFKIFMGFGNTVLPQFFGLSERMPEVEHDSRTVKFHLIDFMSFLFEREVGSTIILEDKRTDEILEFIFENEFNLTPGQFELDTGSNIIPFFYIPKGTKFGPVVEQLMEAEMGRLYMNELGVIRFRNRYNYDMEPVLTLDEGNVIEYKGSMDTNIINSMQVTANPRAVQENQPIYQSIEEYDIANNQTIPIWVPFENPVRTAFAPSYAASEVSDAPYYIASSSQVVLSNFTVFAEAALFEFTNNSGSAQTITDITVWGEPAKPLLSEPINVIEQNQESIDKYEEQWYPSREGIKNDYLQSATAASSLALVVINDHKDPSSIVDLTVRGNPALQLGDAVELNLPGYSGLHIVTKITNLIRSGGFIQRVKVKHREQISFFTLNVSQLDGTDVLGI